MAQKIEDGYSVADKLAIATTTCYNPKSESDVIRAGLATNTIERAVEHGYKIVVVDGGSSDEVLREFERRGAAIFIEKTLSMGAGRRWAIQEAYNTGREVVAWMEPEKESYVPEIHKTVIPILKGEADMVIPCRGPLESYPTAQQYAEPLGNSFWEALTGYRLDVWSGPRTWRRELSDYFLRYSGEYGDKWDSIFIPVMDAIKDDKKVISVDVKYVHPKSQTDLENADATFHIKRVEQLQNIMRALQMHWMKHVPARD